MDPWATDSFYSHFPSHSNQRTQREILAKTRQIEYQTYLSRLADNTAKTSKRSTSINRLHKRQKLPVQNGAAKERVSPVKEATATASKPQINTINETDHLPSLQQQQMDRDEERNRFLRELEKTKLPYIFNDDAINARNRRIAEEKRLKKIQYQQELKAQIEQKEFEKELTKAKDIEEEERLTRRVEEQLRTVRLQDEMERQRQTRERERKLINFDMNKPPSTKQPLKPPITVRSETIEPTVPTYRSYDERKAHSESSKENLELMKQNDKQIYKFFTNSARDTNKFRHMRYNNYCDLEEFSNDDDVLPNSTSSSYNTYPSKSTRNQEMLYKQCQQHNAQAKPMYNLSKGNRFLARSQEENIATCDHHNQYICAQCQHELICLNRRNEVCVRCKRPAHVYGNPQVVAKPVKRTTNVEALTLQAPMNVANQTNATRPRKNSFRLIDTDEDESFYEQYSMNQNSYRKPYSFNVEESSIFHPSKERSDRKLSVSVKNGEVSVQQDSFDELKRITDEKLSKYAKNYGELRKATDQSTRDQSREIASFHIIPDNTKKIMRIARELDDYDNNSDAFKRLQSKWQDPAKQTNKIVQNPDTNTYTLTQVGAFKKQLQLDQLDFDSKH